MPKVNLYEEYYKDTTYDEVSTRLQDLLQVDVHREMAQSYQKIDV